MKAQLFIYLSIFLLFGCQSTSTSSTDEKENFKNSITINFNENIQSLDPYLAKSSSELFVRSMVYDRLVESVSGSSFESRLLEVMSFDSLSRTFSFELKKEVYFGNGAEFYTTHIRNMFEKILSNQTDQEIKGFMESIVGFRPSLYHSLSLPSGIKIIDDHSFTIQINTDPTWFLEQLMQPWCFVANELHGTGRFLVTNLNDDISCSLKRKNISESSNQVSFIELTFIKNKDEEISSFLSQNIDLIEYNVRLHKSEVYHNQLVKMIDNKYANYQINQSKEAVIKYAKIYNTTDSSSLKKLIQSLPITSDMRSSYRANFTLTGNNAIDSTLTQSEQSIEESLSHLASNDQLIANKFDQNLPFYVLNEMRTWNYHGNQEYILNEIFNKEYETDKGDNKWVLVLVEVHPTYYISQFQLKGLKDFMEMKEILNNVTIERPLVY